MSKVPSLDSAVIVRKGHAAPAVTTGAAPVPPAPPAPLEPRKEETLVPSVQVSNEPTEEVTKVVDDMPKRRRPWDGQDEWIKANYEVPKRVQTKLHNLKSWDRIKNLKEFVAKALEAAADKEIAKAEKEGF
jgi:hypothetical protein